MKKKSVGTEQLFVHYFCILQRGLLWFTFLYNVESFFARATLLWSIFEIWVWFGYLFTTSQMFSKWFYFHIFCKCFEFFVSTNNFPNLWWEDFKQVCSNPFCTWDYMFFNKRGWSVPRVFCLKHKNFSTLSSIDSENGKISRIWIKSFVWSIIQKWFIRNLAEPENNSSKSYRYKKFFSPDLTLKSVD